MALMASRVYQDWEICKDVTVRLGFGIVCESTEFVAALGKVGIHKHCEEVSLQMMATVFKFRSLHVDSSTASFLPRRL